jgi:hypothetical protein
MGEKNEEEHEISLSLNIRVIAAVYTGRLPELLMKLLEKEVLPHLLYL